MVEVTLNDNRNPKLSVSESTSPFQGKSSRTVTLTRLTRHSNSGDIGTRQVAIITLSGLFAQETPLEDVRGNRSQFRIDIRIRLDVGHIGPPS